MGKPLPSSLPSLELVVTPGIGSRCLVLHGPGQATAAIDLEARLAETGLASVQITDYRNLAHGRHYGLSKTASDQVVIALIAPPLRRTRTGHPSTAPELGQRHTGFV